MRLLILVFPAFVMDGTCCSFDLNFVLFRILAVGVDQRFSLLGFDSIFFFLLLLKLGPFCDDRFDWC